MGVPDVEQAKRRLQDILTRARQLEIPSDEVISMRASQKLLARTENALAWTIIVGAFVIVLSFVVYARWPTQEVETVRTVLRRTIRTENEQRSVSGFFEFIVFSTGTVDRSFLFILGSELKPAK